MLELSEKVKEHFRNPRNAGEIEDPEAKVRKGKAKIIESADRAGISGSGMGNEKPSDKPGFDLLLRRNLPILLFQEIETEISKGLQVKPPVFIALGRIEPLS